MGFPGPIATISPMVLDGFGSFLTTIFSNNPGGIRAGLWLELSGVDSHQSFRWDKLGI